MGRTVWQGRLYVDNCPVHETAFATDELNPVTESYIPAVLARQCTIPIVIPPAPRTPPAICVWDGQTDDDVMAVAGIVIDSSEPRLAAGPAAMAECLARLIELPRRALPPLPAIRRCAVLNGSRHPVSLDQVRHAREAGLFDTKWVLADDVAACSAFEALIVFGGDTAYEVVTALGVRDIEPLGEAMPGVPVSRAAGRYLITKAGGFGPVDILSTLRRLLSRER